jgi:hypothetical protein
VFEILEEAILGHLIAYWFGLFTAQECSCVASKRNNKNLPLDSMMQEIRRKSQMNQTSLDHSETPVWAATILILFHYWITYLPQICFDLLKSAIGKVKVSPSFCETHTDEDPSSIYRETIIQ